MSSEEKKASKPTSWGSRGRAGNYVLCADTGKEYLLLEPTSAHGSWGAAATATGGGRLRSSPE